MAGTITLALEWIGWNYDRSYDYHELRAKRGFLRVDEYKKHFGAQSRRPWVAERQNQKREFLDGRITHRDSDKKGEHGVYLYFHLSPGPIYEVCHWIDWQDRNHYYCRVESGKIYRINHGEI